MATRRIKEITNTATTFASDDFIALDGTSQGTRKMDKDDLISQVSAGVSGDYLEEANNLSDVASLDTSKLNLEVPDVGTAPNEVPLNGQLGSMAYQSADSVAMGTAEVETLEVTGDATVDGTVYMAANKALNMGGASQLYYNNSTSGLQFTGSAGNNTVFIQASDGKVGIGTDSPDAILETSQSVAGNADGALLTNTNQSGSSDSASLNFGLGRTADSHIFDIPAVKFEKEKQWTGTGSTVDGKLVFSTIQNETISEKAVIDSSGRVGVNQTSPGNYNANGDDLVIGDGSGSRGLSIASGASDFGVLYFARGSAPTGADAYHAYINYNQSSQVMSFGTAQTAQWRIDASGNFVAAQSGNGIDFGSGASTTIDSYEHGDITSVTDASGASLAITADMKYQVIGKSVQISGKITFPTTTDTRAARVTLLPEQCPNADGARGLSVSYTTSGSGLYVMPVGNTNDVMFWNLSGTSQQNSNLSGLTIFISGNYSLN